MTKKINASKKSSKHNAHCVEETHPDHKNFLPNINRIAGQIEGIKKMINEGRYCVDILQQLKSIKSAIGGVETKMLEAHMDLCIAEAFASKNEKEKLQKIEELKALYRGK